MSFLFIKRKFVKLFFCCFIVCGYEKENNTYKRGKDTNKQGPLRRHTAFRVNGHRVRINDIQRRPEINKASYQDSYACKSDEYTGCFHFVLIWHKCKIIFCLWRQLYPVHYKINHPVAACKMKIKKLLRFKLGAQFISQHFFGAIQPYFNI